MLFYTTNFTVTGLRDWLFQRISALVLAAYLLFLMGFIITHPSLDYQQWQHLFSHNVMRIFTILALYAFLAHAWVGMWTVSTDYLHAPHLRLVLQVLGIISLWACVLWGVMILWGF